MLKPLQSAQMIISDDAGDLGTSSVVQDKAARLFPKL